MSPAAAGGVGIPDTAVHTQPGGPRLAQGLASLPSPALEGCLVCFKD